MSRSLEGRMPFARKFRAMMDLPFAGDTFAGFAVEVVEVEDDPQGMGRYVYAMRMILRGLGGQSGVRKALRGILDRYPMTFSAYGNAYQLWWGKPEITSLGDKRYEVRAVGAGARVHLEQELDRFLAYLKETGRLAEAPDDGEGAAAVDSYLAGYRGEVKRLVDRYRRKLRRREGV
jgi:hypothetical protein